MGKVGLQFFPVWIVGGPVPVFVDLWNRKFVYGNFAIYPGPGLRRSVLPAPTKGSGETNDKCSISKCLQKMYQHRTQPFCNQLCEVRTAGMYHLEHMSTHFFCPNGDVKPYQNRLQRSRRPRPNYRRKALHYCDDGQTRSTLS